MRLKSISRRIYLAILTVSIISMAAMITTVLVVNEDLEDTMLSVEFAQEKEFIVENRAGDDVFVWDTPNLVVVFIPTGQPRPAVMPAIFRGLPSRYSAEKEIGDETYLINVETLDNGLLYVAKNITHFEDRETLFDIALLIMALVIVVLSLWLALLSSRRIVTPLKRLSAQISGVPVGTAMPHIDTNYDDAELHAVATTFNRFLDELESYVKREQSLLSLASHELRTPIAVMSGALDIIEQRKQLNVNDATTLQRARRACTEMKGNIEVLLKLARREIDKNENATFNLVPITRRLIGDLKISHAANDRVTLTAPASVMLRADPMMTAMLLRNLIQNALEHTTHQVSVTLQEGLIEVKDQGGGLTQEQQAILRGQTRGSTPLSGLGLYIVTLMCERLGWQLNIAQTSHSGTCIRISPRPTGQDDLK